MSPSRQIEGGYAAALSLLLLTQSLPANAVSANDRESAAHTTFDHSIAAAKVAMLGDPVEARKLGHLAHGEALNWQPGPPREVAIATAEWIEGEGAYRANDIAAAAPLINDALSVIAKVAPGSKVNGDLLLSRARLRRESGQPQKALADFQLAYKLFVDQHDERSEAKVLQSIGSIYQDAQDYERVIYYYHLAEELAANDTILSLSANNNMASAYSHLGRGRDASSAYALSLQLAKKLQSPLLMARILANVGDVAIENHQYDAAGRAISSGLQQTLKPAAASWRPMLLGTRAKLELAEGHLTDALRDVEAAFALANNGTTDQSFSALHLTAYRVYKATGEERQALDHLESYRRMDDEGRTLAASTNAALMSARFDFVNQNARIATLKTGQLSRDVALTRLRARQSTVVFSSLLSLMLIVLMFLFVYLRSVRRNRNEIMRANQQLERSNVDLEGALQAKSQFLATTSHEIRTPLNGILGMTQVILADRDVDERVRDRVILVDAAGRAMRTLVDDILDFAKMDSGAVRLDKEPVDLNSLIPSLVSLWRGQAQDKGIEICLSMTGLIGLLITDGARLSQVVSNLLSNAIKFTASGQVTVDVRATTDRGQQMVTIAVADTGIGIPPAAFDAIFEPFHQLDTSTTRQFGGTGLGLAISRHLARVLGGDITVASKPGAGSTFTLQLPYISLDSAQQVLVDQPHASVLVASANPIRRSFLRTALEAELGHAAECVPGEVLAVLTARTISVVLVDLADDDETSLPTNIVVAMARLAASPPLVLLIPPQLAIHTTAWLAGGAARVVVKPVKADELVAVLREQLRSDVGDQAGTASRSVVLQANLP